MFTDSLDLIELFIFDVRINRVWEDFVTKVNLPPEAFTFEEMMASPPAFPTTTSSGPGTTGSESYVIWTERGVTVNVSRIPAVVGDLTNDRFVDFADLTILLANWNQNVSAGFGNLVSAHDTPVDFADLTALLAGWTGQGPVAAPQGAARGEAVPEPSTLLLGLWAIVSAAITMRRNRNRSCTQSAPGRQRGG